MSRAVVGVALLGACSFMPRAASVGGDDARAIDGAGSDAGIDAPDAGSGSGSGSATSPAKRKPIVIDKTKITGALDDFPVWIDLSDAQIAAQARPDGHDIYFTDSTGAALPYEIEDWSGGRLRAWVRVPHLDMTTTVTIYVGYGDDTRAVAQTPATVFSTYAAVWHLDDTLAAAAITDATNTHPGTAMGLATGAQGPAQLVGGITFDGSGNQKISFTSPLTGTGPHTISAWVNQGTTNNHSAILTVGVKGADTARFLYGNYLATSSLGIGQYGDDWQPSRDLRGAGWKLVHWTYEGMATKTSHVYVDGVEVTGSPHAMRTAANTPASTGTIGYAPEPDFGNPTGMLGTLDEVRIATSVKSGPWIAAEFSNQKTPATFYTVGAEQAAP